MALLGSDNNIKDRWYHRLISSVLQMGPIPEHVGFIMDGNRRFARQKSMKTIEGHSEGFNKLAEVLKW